jgi:hypothetical protein
VGVFLDAELHFGEDVLVPDLAGWRRERMPELPATAFLTVPPDWLCEVLGRSTAETSPDLRPRNGEARLAGRPNVKTLEIFRLDGTTDRLVATFRGDKGSGRAIRCHRA